MTSIVVSTGYAPRPLQAELHRRLRRFSVLVCHRRFGKTVLAVNELIDRALRCRLERPRYAYIAPYRNQAKQISWDYLQAHLRPIPGVEFNQAELRADLPNGARITVYGADNPDSLRGIYLDGVVFDEFAQMPQRLWSEIIRPALADRKGWAVWIGTPMGRNAFYEIYEYARTTADPEWFAALYRASETGVVDQAELDSARREMADDDRYQQEFECSFQAAIIGAYYGPQMREAEEAKRVTRVPYEPHVKVITAWDLGVGDSTAIWFAQQVGKEIRLIDYYEASGVGLDHYARVLQDRGYVYGEHLLPHDVRVKELGTGVSRLDTLEKLGLRNVRVIPQLGVDDGISAVRGLLPRCWFDEEKTKRGRDALAQYRREYDDKLKAFKNRPLHDWTSHCFRGDVEVLTRYGMRRIMDLPEIGEVLTPCGWKAYRNPRITRRHAPLVEVAFSDGLTVRCTPDHLFLTVSGWKSANSLQKGSLIQSSLTRSRSISMGACIAYGRLSDTLRGAARSFTAMFGSLLSGLSPLAAISITGTGTPITASFPTSNACLRPLTSPTPGLRAVGPRRKATISATSPVSARLNGTSPKRAVFGTSDMPNGPKAGRNGSANRGHALSAARKSWLSSALAVISRSSAAITAKPLTIASVKPLAITADVWCLTVPDGECFSLANGAVVHNCADAARYLAVGLREGLDDWDKPLKADTGWIV